MIVVCPDSFSEEYCVKMCLLYIYPGRLIPDTTLRQSGIYQYVLMEDGTAAIITADGEGELVIPAELDGYPVSRIGLEVSDLQEEIYFAANIYILDDDDELTIDRSVIDGNFTGVILPEGITVIGAEAFCVCDWLTEITLPESVTHIGEYAFYQSGLTAITLPDGVETVEERAFRKCSSLSSVVLPDSITSIGACAFANTGLTEVRLPAGLTVMEFGLFLECADLRNVVLPDGLTEIESEAFFGCFSLTLSTLPDTLTKIGSRSFSGCQSLTDLFLPDSIEEIEWDAFFHCDNLTCRVTEGSEAQKYCEHNKISYTICQPEP